MEQTVDSLRLLQALSGNYDAVDIHTLGIKQVVALRGGPDQLGTLPTDHCVRRADNPDDSQVSKGF